MSRRLLLRDVVLLRRAAEVAKQSRDPSTKVGAVLVSSDGLFRFEAFNRLPHGLHDSPALYADRAYKYKHVIHAEVGALTAACQYAEGASIYTSFPCCSSCVEALVKAGVKRAFCLPVKTAGRSSSWLSQWEAELKQALYVAEAKGLEMRFVHV